MPGSFYYAKMEVIMDERDMLVEDLREQVVQLSNKVERLEDELVNAIHNAFHQRHYQWPHERDMRFPGHNEFYC